MRGATMSEASMFSSPDADHLSHIETVWTMIYHAHSDSPTQGHAQHQLLARYGSAIQRYLRGAFRDDVAAEETYQEFAIRFLRGDYRSAHPDKGRFRAFLKVVLSRLVADHYRKLSRRRETTLESDDCLVDSSDREEIEDAAFRRTWRDEMLTQAWRRLAEEESRSGKPWMTLLKLRVDNPDLRSVELGQKLAKYIGEEISATRLRVLLHRSRERFANYLIDVVSESVPNGSIAEAEQELADLELLQYCQSVLERRKQAD